MAASEDSRSLLWAIRPWHVAVVLLCLPLIVIGTMHVTRRIQLRHRIETVRAAGYPVTREELEAWRPTPPAGENAADDVMQAVAHLRMPDEETSPLFKALESRSLLAGTQPLDDQTRSTITKLLDENTEAIRLLGRAAQFAHCRYPADSIPGMNVRPPDSREFHFIVSLFCLKAALHVEEGNWKSAVDATINAYRLADSLAEDPVIVSQMLRRICQMRATAMLERTLNRASVDAEHLERLQQTLAAACDPNALEKAFICEQCFTLDNFRQPLDVGSAAYFRGLTPIRLRMARLSGTLDLVQIRYMDWTDKYIAVVRRPLHERVQAAADIQNQRDRLHDRGVFLSEILPAFHGVIFSEAEHLARLLTARTALAVEQYHAAAGRWPGQLTDLVPEYLAQMPRDPFDGQSLRYHRRPNGYIVYSVGRDLTDNGGAEKASTGKGQTQPDGDIPFTVER